MQNTSMINLNTFEAAETERLHPCGECVGSVVEGGEKEIFDARGGYDDLGSHPGLVVRAYSEEEEFYARSDV